MHENDNFNKIINDVVNAKIEYLDYQTHVTLSGTQAYSSQVAFNNFSAPHLWEGKYIRFHSPSEHTIGGQKFGLEMQIYFSAAYERGPIKDSVISILFDTSANQTESSSHKCLQYGYVSATLDFQRTPSN